MRVIGTAGHVDHGKSSLVRRLTGIDPDRLLEEKAREMTIDLGFAWFDLPTGETIGVVDVPGHRDFIENMLAGVGGIDAVLLVIAADEGVMPQTREHLAILDLLDIQHGLIVLSKVDLVEDEDWLVLIEDEIRQALSASTLANAPLLRVSAHTGAGMPELLAALTVLLRELPPHSLYGQPRLPIDRVFTISGFGTVVTGTLLGGTLHIGDEIVIQPGELYGRIRGLQSYQRMVDTVHAGSRAAVNIAGIDRQSVERGQVLTMPGNLHPSDLVDVYFRHLADAERPLKHNMQVKFFVGAAETTAYVRLLNDEQLSPGAQGWLQLRLDRPLAVSRGDRFIMRLPSPAQTIGGGVVVNPQPKARWRRFQPSVIAALETLLGGTPAERLAQAAMGSEPLKREALRKETGFSDADLTDALQEALEAGIVLQLSENTYLAAESVHYLLHRIADELRAFHAEAPLRLGMPREALRSKIGVKLNTLYALLDVAGEVVQESGVLRLAHHQIVFSAEQQARIAALLEQMEAAPYTPLAYADAVALAGEDVLRALIDLNTIVQVQADVIFTRGAYDTMIAGILNHIDQHGSISAAEFRDVFNSSRKYAIAMLEHLDSSGITARSGDARVRGRNAPRP